jgi:glutathione peroxidase
MFKSLIIVASLFFTVSIYSITEADIDGNAMSFSTFAGKKILIVNTATNSPYVPQFVQLEELYQQYKDSLVVIAFPSNSFGHETGDNASIKSFVQSTYNIHFILGAKVNVKETEQAGIYSWLTSMTQNGMLNSEVHDDFQKYLINGSGTLIGVFNSSIQPMDSLIQKAILEN